MWGLPTSTLFAFVALVLTVLAALTWAILSKKDDHRDSPEDDA